MELSVGAILEGKVTGITKFGAFVSLPDGKSGMVHISEVANSFVNDINDFLKEGQAVRVKVIGIDGAGRINLSIKKALPAAESAPARPAAPQQRRGGAARPRGPQRQQPRDPSTMTFEDKLKMFMADSESRMADIKHNNDRKSGSRRRK
jgi:S1 RNA binding domain protein